MSSLGRRLLTASVLIPLAVWSVLGLATAHVAILFGLIALGAAWEWAGFAGLGPRGRIIYGLSVVLALRLVYGLAESLQGALFVLALAALWWCAALLWIAAAQGARNPRFMAQPTAVLGAGLLVLAPAWLALVALHGAGPDGPRLVLLLLVLIWTADSGAYFAGRRFGRRLLAAKVSPGKTWEGAAGGLMAVLVLSLLAVWYLDVAGVSPWLFVLLCAATVPVSILGDLAESLFKRQANVKDSGGLLPGHGGVLDRIDSLTAAAPFFSLGLYWLGARP